MFHRLAFMSPDDVGGAAADVADATTTDDAAAATTTTLDEKDVQALAKMGLDVKTASTEDIVKKLLGARNEEIKGRQKERKDRQTAQTELTSAKSKLTELSLGDLLGTEGIPDDAKEQLRELGSKAQKAGEIEAALNGLVEANQMPKELAVAIFAGPIPVAAYLAGVQAGGGGSSNIAQEVTGKVLETLGQNSGVADGLGVSQQAGKPTTDSNEAIAKTVLAQSRGNPDVEAMIKQGKDAALKRKR